MDLAKTALRYLELGWSVIPGHWVADGLCSCGKSNCEAPGKHPLIRWAAYQTQRPTPALVASWWSRWPRANILVVTGRVSNLVVLDLDPDRGGLDSRQELFPEWAETPICITGGGGYHLYFSHPGGVIPNAVDIAPGVDVRADGGYVVAPPSAHASGRRYEWEVGHEPWVRKPAPLPERIRALLTERGAITVHVDVRTFDIEKVLSEPIPEGKRDTTLTQIAGHFFGTWGVEKVLEIYKLLLDINTRLCQPPLPSEQVEKIVKSIYSRELKKRATETVVEEIQKNPGLEVENITTPEGRAEIQAAAWAKIGLPVTVRETVCYRNDETVFYKLVTESGESVPIGADLISQQAVRRAVANYLQVLLPQRTRKEWEQLLAPVLATVTVMDVDAPIPQLVWDWIAQWFSEQPPIILDVHERDAAVENLRYGRPVKYEGYLWLRVGALVSFLEGFLRISISPHKLARYLAEVGFERAWLKDSGGRTTKGWRCPITAVPARLGDG